MYFEVVSTASGVPGCDSFRTETVWIVSPEEEGIRLTGRMMCRFLKRTHLMGQITSAFYQVREDEIEGEKKKEKGLEGKLRWLSLIPFLSDRSIHLQNLVRDCNGVSTGSFIPLRWR